MVNLVVNFNRVQTKTGPRTLIIRLRDQTRVISFGLVSRLAAAYEPLAEPRNEEERKTKWHPNIS